MEKMDGQKDQEITTDVLAEKSSEGDEDLNNEELLLCCTDCSYKCETENMMSKHMNTKHIKNQFCDICSKKFMSTEKLEAHKISAHKIAARKSSRKGRQLKKCEMCGYNSKSDDDWKYHLATEHRYEECDECGIMLSNMNHLNEHFKQTKCKSSYHEENFDVSLDEERLARLQKSMEAAEAAGGFTY